MNILFKKIEIMNILRFLTLKNLINWKNYNFNYIGLVSQYSLKF